MFAYRDNPHLRELTSHRTVASIPFGGRYRMIDFMLSNMVNAGIVDMRRGHAGEAASRCWIIWAAARTGIWPVSAAVCRCCPPSQNQARNFRGKMEALYGVYSYVEDIKQDYVVMADGDVACNIDLEAVFQSHLESGADITAVCTTNLSGDPQAVHLL